MDESTRKSINDKIEQLQSEKNIFNYYGKFQSANLDRTSRKEITELYMKEFNLVEALDKINMTNCPAPKICTGSKVSIYVIGISRMVVKSPLHIVIHSCLSALYHSPFGLSMDGAVALQLLPPT